MAIITGSLSPSSLGITGNVSIGKGEKGEKGETGAIPSITHLETQVDLKCSEVDAKLITFDTDGQQAISDIQADYDTLKGGLLATDKVVYFQNELNTINASLETKANKNEIGTPLITSSIVGMTDKNKVYVNTTDGKWYSWNGTAWVIGGIYNSQGIGDGQVTGEKTNFLLNDNKNLFNGTFLNGYVTGSGTSNGRYTTNTSAKTIAINLEPNTDYTILKQQIALDGDYQWFKLITFTQTVEEVINSMTSGNTSLFNGTIYRFETSNVVTQHTFNSGANKSMFLTVAKTLTPYVEVLKGTFSSFQYSDYNPIYKTQYMYTDLSKSYGLLKKNNVDFILAETLNLLDGNLLNCYLSGTETNPSFSFSNNVTGYKTMIVDVKPSTTYTILKKPTAIDGIYYYFKVATFTKTKNELLALSSYTVDGSVKYTNTATDTEKYTFTTGANDKSLVLVIGKNNLSYAEMNEGNYSVFKSEKYGVIYSLKDIEVYSKKEIDTKLVDVRKNNIIKIGNVLNITLANGTTYKLENKIDNSIGLNTFMLTEGRKDGVIIWSGSDIEAPIKEKGAIDFIGGVHGDEVYESVQILCNGVLLNNSLDYNLDFYNLTIFVKSTLYRCNTTTPVFTRYKKLEFKDNQLFVQNNLISLTDFIVERYCGDGLYSVYKDMCTGYTVNTSPMLYTTGEVVSSDKLVEGNFYCSNFTVNVKTIGTQNVTHLGYVQDFYNEARPRFKLYLDAINSTNGITIKSGESLNNAYVIKIT